MTLQKLLKSVDVEKVLPIIHQWYYDGEEFAAKEGYRRAYKELCTLEPAVIGSALLREMEKDEIDACPDTILLNAPEDGFDHHWCMKIEFRYWALLVDKEVEYAPGVILTDEEAAAVCLWHITFCGFDSGAVERKFLEWNRTTNS